MDIIYSLLKNLNRMEIDALKKHIRVFANDEEDEEEVEFKTLKLIELTLKHGKKCLDDNFYCEKLYGGVRKNTFSKLKARAKNKILDSITLDVNLERRNVLDEVLVMGARIKKKLAAIDLMVDKGQTNVVYKLLDDIIDMAKKYEIYPQLVEALLRYKWTRSYREGKEEFEKIDTEIKHYNKCHAALIRAKDYYSNLLMLTAFTKNPDKEKVKAFVLPAIKEINNDLSATDSVNVKYYLKLLELGYYNILEDYEQAKKICDDILDIIPNNKPVNVRRRLGIAYDNLCACEINLLNFKKAAANARNAQEYFTVGSTNHTTSKEYEFYANFHEGNFKKADEISKYLLNTSDAEHGSFRKARYLYLRANISFRLEKYNEVLQRLIKIEDILIDKSGWNIGVRLLTIMSCIELNRIEQAVSGIESLRKHIERSSKDSSIRDRDRTILKLLYQMHKEGFVFFNFHKNEHLLEALRSLKDRVKKEMRWEVLGHELIPFHTWVESKMRFVPESHSQNGESTVQRYTPLSLSESVAVGEKGISQNK
jgi:tetratricopeptide (TPR) repeat protein